MPRFGANLNFLFTELPFFDRFEAAAKVGFGAVESTNLYEASAGGLSSPTPASTRRRRSAPVCSGRPR